MPKSTHIRPGDVCYATRLLPKCVARFYLRRSNCTARQLEFWIALNEGDLDGMREAVDNGADPEDKTEPSAYRPVHLAAAIGNLEALLLLMEFRVDVNAQTANGTTALHYAANHGDVLVTSMLLSDGADPNLTDKRKFAPLHFASYANQ